MRAYPCMGVPARAGVHPLTHIDASNLLIFIYITKRPHCNRGAVLLYRTFSVGIFRQKGRFSGSYNSKLEQGLEPPYTAVCINLQRTIPISLG